jgi:hypothetical protein
MEYQVEDWERSGGNRQWRGFVKWLEDGILHSHRRENLNLRYHNLLSRLQNLCSLALLYFLPSHMGWYYKSTNSHQISTISKETCRFCNVSSKTEFRRAYVYTRQGSYRSCHQWRCPREVIISIDQLNLLSRYSIFYIFYPSVSNVA